MSRGIFNSNNKTTEVFTFKTNSDSGTTFDPQFFTNSGGSNRRVHIDYGDGSVGYETGPNFSHTYSDNGDIKDVKVYFGDFDNIVALNLVGDGIYGTLDLTNPNFVNSYNFSLHSNSLLSGVTHGYNPSNTTQYYVYGCNITGNHDVSMFPNLGGDFRMHSNPNLTSITHTGSSQVFTYYNVYNCNITGNHDVSMFPNLGGFFQMQSNTYLTGVTHTYSPQVFTLYYIYDSNITGNHDVSMFPNLGGSFHMANNTLLTSVTHTGSSQTFTYYRINNCDITGNHDLSMFPIFGGDFSMYNNPNLTGVTHTYSPQTFSSYWLYNCDITGNHDLSMFPNLGGTFIIDGNPNLTSITHTGSTQNITYRVQNCDITGTHDLTMFPNLGGVFSMEGNDNLIEVLHTASTQTLVTYNIGNNNSLLNVDISMLSGLGRYVQIDYCPLLTGVTFPQSTETFRNVTSSVNNRAFSMFLTPNVDYIDFKPLSGGTMDVNSTYGCTIDIRSHGMTSGEVNRTLVDFEWITTNNPTRWSGVTLDISSNSVPDTTSDGYNGISALSTLTGATYQWTITTD